MDISNKHFQINIKLGSADGFPLVVIDGECDAFTAPFTHGSISELIDVGHTGIIVDISELRYMDGAGFDALDRCCVKIKAVDGMLLLVNPGKNVEEIYEILRERDSCDIEKTIESALVKLKRTLKPRA